MSLPPVAAIGASRPMSLDDLARLIRPLLVRLAEHEAPLDGETLECVLCGQEIPYTYSTWQAHRRSSGDYGGELASDQRAHAPDCPWRQARELLGIPLNRVEVHERARLDIPAEMTVWEFPP